jgi:hypothetical protein
VVLQYDPEPMVWQASPSAIAVLTPKALKWLLIVLVGLVAGAWLGASLAGSGTSPAGRDAAAAVQWALVLLPLALMAWSLGIS